MLSYKEKELIKSYVSHHQSFKLTDLCVHLIDNGSSNETYSTGKYKIYPYIAIYIEAYLPRSAVEIIQTESDVQYNITGDVAVKEEQEKAEVKVDKGIKEERPKKETAQQLSLF